MSAHLTVTNFLSLGALESADNCGDLFTLFQVFPLYKDGTKGVLEVAWTGALSSSVCGMNSRNLEDNLFFDIHVIT